MGNNHPTITNFEIPNKKVGDAPFEITQPTSTSTGAFSYNSSDTTVATVSGNIITILSAGNTTIFAYQAPADSWDEGYASTVFYVSETDPVIITDATELADFMNSSSSTNGNVINSLQINYNLIATGRKSLSSTNGNIKITKILN